MAGAADDTNGGASRLEALDARSALQAALTAIRSPALLLAPDGTIVDANPAAARLLALHPPRALAVFAETRDGAHSPGWRLTPLGGPGERFGFIAVLDSDGGAAQGPAATRDRWCNLLTARQAEVLDLVARGLTNATIAELLEIKERTVEFHLSAIFDKAGVESRTALLAKLLPP